MDKLKECLRCKSPDIAIKKMFGGIHGIFCPKCGTLVSIAGCENLEDAIAAWNTRTAPINPPLTLDELRGMVGEPVWVAEEESYAIVTMDKQGCYANQVFVRGVRHMRDGVEYGFGINYELDVKKRRLQCYRHKPEMEETTRKDTGLI